MSLSRPEIFEMALLYTPTQCCSVDVDGMKYDFAASLILLSHYYYYYY